MVIYPNAIVDHHFDELNFFLIWCAACFPFIHITVAFNLFPWRNLFTPGAASV
jgi:hypothetical protein